MNIALRKPMTLQQFLAWEERQDLRCEFDGFQPVAMTGGTIGHERITFNLRKALDARLAGGPCHPHGPNVKIIADGKVRYPDAIVAYAPVSVTATVVDNPVVVFEVLSEGTADTDVIEKNREYRATPSIQRYVIVQQTHAAAIVFVRQGDAWLSEIVAGDDGHLHMPEIAINVALAELYVGIELSADETAEPSV
jgi:Uma2 family endonuclease